MNSVPQVRLCLFGASSAPLCLCWRLIINWSCLDKPGLQFILAFALENTSFAMWATYQRSAQLWDSAEDRNQLLCSVVEKPGCFLVVILKLRKSESSLFYIHQLNTSCPQWENDLAGPTTGNGQGSWSALFCSAGVQRHLLKSPRIVSSIPPLNWQNAKAFFWGIHK